MIGKRNYKLIEHKSHILAEFSSVAEPQLSEKCWVFINSLRSNAPHPYTLFGVLGAEYDR